MHMIGSAQLQAAYKKARADLLAARTAAGHWEGHLSSSALSTATAVSALAVAARASSPEASTVTLSDYLQLVERGVAYLVGQQNGDGGWGDTDRSYSNIATTMLVIAALHLAEQEARHPRVLERARAYVDSQGGIGGLRARYGVDKTFVVPILTNCALAGVADWSQVSPLPFEWACLPQRYYRWAQLPVVSYAIPALVAIGQARFLQGPPPRPWTRLVRRAAIAPSMRVLERMQPSSGGYLEAAPLTSFVAMSLAATGRADHPVTRAALRFLCDTVRPDGSWPIDTNLATWTTSLAINALATHGTLPPDVVNLDWFLDCQHRVRHPFTGADPGGWGWTNLSGAVPDADDTAGALLACRHWRDQPQDGKRVTGAARQGVQWLLDLQNRDGGWPTFCRGWGKLPFDRSGADLTAHAMRALHAWRELQPRAIERALRRGWSYLQRHQRPDGSWVPLWFGNQDEPQEENPVYGTARVLLAYHELGADGTNEAERGYRWLAAVQREDGSWGGGPADRAAGSVEETALALEALVARRPDAALRPPLEQGLQWLTDAVLADRHRESSPIGFYFAKLWYYEQLYPLLFAVAALGRAVHGMATTVCD